jgi:uncharacterized tellurite resistance protein B-like protein
MGFFGAWKVKSQWLWDKVACKFQHQYDNIDSWETPAWLKKATEKIWDELDEEMRKKLYEFIMEVVKKYDAKFAKELLQDLLNKLLELLKLKKKED